MCSVSLGRDSNLQKHALTNNKRKLICPAQRMARLEVCDWYVLTSNKRKLICLNSATKFLFLIPSP